MLNLKLEQLKKQRIITDLENMVASTWLKGHPSLGESDEVVWVYEIVRDEFKEKIQKKIPLVKPFIK
jgi:hypothetical protein